MICDFKLKKNLYLCKKKLFNIKYMDMKKLFLIIGLALSILFLPVKLWSQECPNLDFSRGNFTNWQGYTGTTNSVSPSAITPGRHTIMNAAQLMETGEFYDEHCPLISKVPPGFAYSARL